MAVCHAPLAMSDRRDNPKTLWTAEAARGVAEATRVLQAQGDGELASKVAKVVAQCRDEIAELTRPFRTRVAARTMTRRLS